MSFRLMNNDEELLPDKFDYIPLAQEKALELTYDREVTEPMILLECGHMRAGDDHNNDEWEPTREFAIIQQSSSRCVELSSKCGMLKAKVEQLERQIAKLKKTSILNQYGEPVTVNQTYYFKNADGVVDYGYTKGTYDMRSQRPGQLLLHLERGFYSFWLSPLELYKTKEEAAAQEIKKGK